MMTIKFLCIINVILLLSPVQPVPSGRMTHNHNFATPCPVCQQEKLRMDWQQLYFSPEAHKIATPQYLPFFQWVTHQNDKNQVTSEKEQKPFDYQNPPLELFENCVYKYNILNSEYSNLFMYFSQSIEGLVLQNEAYKHYIKTEIFKTHQRNDFNVNVDQIYEYPNTLNVNIKSVTQLFQQIEIKKMPNIPIPSFDHLIQISQSFRIASIYHKRSTYPFMTHQLKIKSFRPAPEELFFQSQTLGFAFFKVQKQKKRRVLIQNVIKIKQQQEVIVEVEINQVYPMITSPIIVIQMGDGATLLYVLNIFDQNDHFSLNNLEIVNNQEIKKKNSYGFNSKKPPKFSFNSIPCKSTKDCMTSVQQSRKWFQRDKKIRMQIDFDYKLYIRPTFIQFGSIIARSGVKNADLLVQLRYIEHTFKHLSIKMNREIVDFQIIIQKHQIIPYWMLSDHPYDKQQNENKKKRHQYYDQYKTSSFAFFKFQNQNINVVVSKRDSNKDLILNLGKLYFFPGEKGVYRGTLAITLLFKPLNYSYQYFIQYEARVFGSDILQTQIFFQNPQKEYLFEFSTDGQDPNAFDPLKSQCKQYREALNMSQMALNLPITDLDQDGNIIQQPKTTLGRRTRQSDEQIVNVKKISIFQIATQGIIYHALNFTRQHATLKFNSSKLKNDNSQILLKAFTSIGQITFNPDFATRSLLCFTPKTIGLINEHTSEDKKLAFNCPNPRNSQNNNNPVYKLDKDGIYYIVNESQYPYRLVFKPSNLIFRIVLVQNVSLNSGQIFQIRYCSQMLGGINCAWMYPKSILKLRILLKNNIKINSTCNSSEVKYSMIVVIDDYYTKGMRQWKKQGYNLQEPSLMKDKLQYIIQMSSEINDSHIEISPPQLHFQDIYFRKIQQRFVTVTMRKYSISTNPIRNIISLDSRVIVQQLEVFQSKFTNIAELKVSLKIQIDLQNSLLSPSFMKIQRQFIDRVLSPPNLFEIFDWKRKQLEWKYLQENGLDIFESHIVINFENNQKRIIPIKGKIRKLSVIQNNGDLLYGSTSIQQAGNGNHTCNRILLKNQSSFPIVASLWLAAASYGDIQIRQHMGFQMKEFTKQTKQQMDKELIVQNLRTFAEKCQQNPETFSQMYNTPLDCKTSIQNKFGIQFNRSQLQITSQ